MSIKIFTVLYINYSWNGSSQIQDCNIETFIKKSRYFWQFPERRLWCRKNKEIENWSFYELPSSLRIYTVPQQFEQVVECRHYKTRRVVDNISVFDMEKNHNCTFKCVYNGGGGEWIQIAQNSVHVDLSHLFFPNIIMLSPKQKYAVSYCRGMGVYQRTIGVHFEFQCWTVVTLPYLNPIVLAPKFHM